MREPLVLLSELMYNRHMRYLVLNLLVGMSLVGATADASLLATVLGRADPSQEFVQSLIQNTISLPNATSFETELSTGLYSILAREGIEHTVSVEVMPTDGAVSLWESIEAARAAAQSAPVVLWIFRGGIGHNDLLCREMANFPDVAFVFPAGSDGTGQAIDAEAEPHCLSKNILIVTALDQEQQVLAPFSNFGEGVRLAAPGVSIPMTVAGGRQVTRSGVSPALAFAAAQLSVYEQRYPDLRGAALINAFLENATLSLACLSGQVEGNHAILARSNMAEPRS